MVNTKESRLYVNADRFMNSRNTKLEPIKIDDNEIFHNVRWYLMFDQYLFHVYVAVRLGPKFAVRIDWSDDSILTFSKFKVIEGQRRIRVGRNDFCKGKIKRAIKKRLERGYSLFNFNCRTVSYLLLVKMGGFNKEDVYSLFVENNTLCGLEPEQCINPQEIRHFIEWEQNQDDRCVIF